MFACGFVLDYSWKSPNVTKVKQWLNPGLSSALMHIFLETSLNFHV